MSSNKDSKHVERIEIIESNDSNKIIKNNGDIDVEKFIEIFGNDVDRKIIQKLSKVPRFASDLSKDLGISKPAIKKHLDKLIRVGVILHHSKDINDDKKRYFCLNPNLSLTFRIDLSSNYFNYRAENTAPVTRGIFEKLEKEKAGKHIVQETVLGIKGITGKKKGKHTEISEEEEKEARLEQKRDLLQINTSLIQLGRALRNVEIQIRDIENNRLEILGEKNEYIARIKDVLETLVKDPMEREIISSFFYKTVQSLKDGISIKEFLSDIYLKFPGSRAGIDYTGKDSGKKIPEYIKKQEERIKMLEETLTNIIEGFDFIKIVYDESCGEKHIYFDF